MTLEIVYRDPRTLKAYERNARTHSPEQIELLRGSIREFGFTNPILLRDDGVTVGAGHGRLEAALAEELAEVPTIILPGLTEDQWRAYVIADNQLAITGSGWDEDLLRAELDALKNVEFDLGIMGFDESDLAKLFATKGQVDPDDAPEPPDVPVSRPGDVWLLGDHRLVGGSSTDPDDVAKALDGQTPLLMVTDPPYGVNYDPSWRERDLATWKAPRATGKVQNDDQADWTEAWELFPGDVVYVWHGGLHTAEVERTLTAAGFEIRSQIIWAKQHFVIGRGNYHWQHEPCWYAVRKGKKTNYVGDRKQSTVWEIQNASAMGGNTTEGASGHGTQKPIECMRRPIENNSKPGDRVYEPFCGSGTTIIACEMTGRICHSLELDPSYVDVCVNRWQTFVGGEATLEESGQTFAQVKEARHEASRHREPVSGLNPS